MWGLLLKDDQLRPLALKDRSNYTLITFVLKQTLILNNT